MHDRPVWLLGMRSWSNDRDWDREALTVLMADMLEKLPDLLGGRWCITCKCKGEQQLSIRLVVELEQAKTIDTYHTYHVPVRVAILYYKLNLNIMSRNRQTQTLLTTPHTIFTIYICMLYAVCIPRRQCITGKVRMIFFRTTTKTFLQVHPQI